MSLLKEKRIVVTGASRGIGLEVVKHCINEGAQVILISRYQKDLDQVLTQLPKSELEQSNYCLDISNPKTVQFFAEHVKKKWGQFDGLVNCAGVLGPIGKTAEVDINEFAQTLEINFLGTFYMCQALLPLLDCSQRAKIVNFSGGGAAQPFPNYTAYAASKAAVVRFSENIACEYRSDGIDINVVAPGFVATQIHEKTLKAGERAGQYLERTKQLLAEGGVPADVAAELCVFLLSKESDGITGKFISAPWDPWKEKDFQDRLRQDPNFATLRRIDDRHFVVKQEKSNVA